MLDYEPALVAVQIELGPALARAGHPDEASATLRRAIHVAEAGHDDRMVARAAAALVPIVLMLGHVDEARAVVELGSAALARDGGDPAAELDLTDARAQVASASGDHEGAIRLVRSMIEPIRARAGEDSMELGELYVMLSREYIFAGRLNEAAEASKHEGQIELALLARMGGTNELALEQRISNAELTGQFADAISLSHELVALARTSPGRDALERIALVSLARAYEIAGDAPRATVAYQDVLDLLDRTPSATDVDRSDTLEGLGSVRLSAGDASGAIAPLREAVALDMKIGPAAADSLTAAGSALGRALYLAGQPHQARLVLEPIVRLLANAPVARASRRGLATSILARALWDDGDAHDRARAVALAGDAQHDLETGLEAARPQPALATFVRLIEHQHAELVTWRARHR